MPARKKKSVLVVPQTCLIDVSDALSIIRDTVHVAANAVSNDAQGGDGVSMVLMQHVFEPIERARLVIEEHVKHCPPPEDDGDIDFLVQDRPRKKHKAKTRRR